MEWDWGAAYLALVIMLGGVVDLSRCAQLLQLTAKREGRARLDQGEQDGL
jgi:hypothetical protein